MNENIKIFDGFLIWNYESFLQHFYDKIEDEILAYAGFEEIIESVKKKGTDCRQELYYAVEAVEKTGKPQHCHLLDVEVFDSSLIKISSEGEEKLADFLERTLKEEFYDEDKISEWINSGKIYLFNNNPYFYLEVGSELTKSDNPEVFVLDSIKDFEF